MRGGGGVSEKSHEIGVGNESWIRFSLVNGKHHLSVVSGSRCGFAFAHCRAIEEQLALACVARERCRPEMALSGVPSGLSAIRQQFRLLTIHIAGLLSS